MNESGQVKTGRLDSLEPHGSTICLDDLLRWRLAASQLPLGNQRSSLLTGGRRSTLRGRGIDFDEVRLYQPGDDVRAIDWRVTARANKPHTKVFREEKERPVLVMIDLRSSMFFGSRRTFKSVLAAHCAALLAWATLEAGDRIGALIVSDDGITDIKPRRSRHAILQIFRKLVSIQQSHIQKNHIQKNHIQKNYSQKNHSQHDSHVSAATTTVTPAPKLTDVMHQLRAVSKPGTCMVLLSDFHDWNDECLKALFPAVRHSQAFAIRIIDPLEKSLPDIGTVRFRFAQWLLPVDTTRQQLRQRYAQQQQEQLAQWIHNWRQLASTSAVMSTTDAVLPALRAIFANGRRPTRVVIDEGKHHAV